MSYSPLSNTTGLYNQLAQQGTSWTNAGNVIQSALYQSPYPQQQYQTVPTLSLCYGCRRECSTLKHIESKKGLWLCGDCHIKEGYEW